MKYLLASVSFSILLVSCALNRPLMKRDQYGLNYQRKSSQDPLFAPIKKKVALLTFYNESPMGGDDLSIMATQELKKELGKTRDYLVDPAAEQLFGSSKEIYASGGSQLVGLVRKAKSSGINLIIYGRIIKAKVRQQVDEIGMMRDQRSTAQAQIEIKVFDVHVGKEVYQGLQEALVDDKNYRFYLDDQKDNQFYRKDLLRYSAQVAVRKFVPTFIELGRKLEWIGRVARIIGSKIYINAGRTSGIQVGDILKITTEGQEIFDPETGAMIGHADGEVKGTVEIIDYFGPDGAVAILHSGGSVTEGDFVELY